MSVVSRMEDGVFDHAIDINRFDEGVKRRTIGFLKEMSDDISRLLSDSPTLLQADRLNSLLGQVDGVIADAHKSAKVNMRNQLIDFAPIEEKATTKIMNDSLEANLNKKLIFIRQAGRCSSDTIQVGDVNEVGPVIGNPRGVRWVPGVLADGERPPTPPGGAALSAGRH